MPELAGCLQAHRGQLSHTGSLLQLHLLSMDLLLPSQLMQAGKLHEPALQVTDPHEQQDCQLRTHASCTPSHGALNRVQHPHSSSHMQTDMDVYAGCGKPRSAPPAAALGSKNPFAALEEQEEDDSGAATMPSIS